MPAKKGANKGGKNTTGSHKAGLNFPVGRIKRMMKKGLYTTRLGGSAGVYMASVLESIVEDIVECAASQADIAKRTALTPRHLQLGIRNDPELSKLFANCSINMGGVLPNAQYMRKDQLLKYGMEAGTQ